MITRPAQGQISPEAAAFIAATDGGAVDWSTALPVRAPARKLIMNCALLVTAAGRWPPGARAQCARACVRARARYWDVSSAIARDRRLTEYRPMCQEMGQTLCCCLAGASGAAVAAAAAIWELTLLAPSDKVISVLSCPSSGTTNKRASELRCNSDRFGRGVAN